MSILFFSHIRNKRRKEWRWPHFSPEELASKGNRSLRINTEALDRLEYARNLVGKPFLIYSAYRDPIYNAKVGGAPLSRHKMGDAFDIALHGHDQKRLLICCQRAGFRGFGFYKTFLHIDLGRRRCWGSW
ncbi:MAG: YcbK family protein [Alphaproteobacteria bacterium]